MMEHEAEKNIYKSLGGNDMEEQDHEGPADITEDFPPEDDLEETEDLEILDNAPDEVQEKRSGIICNYQPPVDTPIGFFQRILKMLLGGQKADFLFTTSHHNLL